MQRPEIVFLELCIIEGTADLGYNDDPVNEQEALTVLLRAQHPFENHPKPKLFYSELRLFQRYDEAVAMELLDQLLSIMPISSSGT